MSIEVRRIQPDDWALSRELRLAALADAPDAFAATLAEESALPEARWRERARLNAEGQLSVGFFAVAEDVACGLVVGLWSESQPPSVELNALWVAPAMRRSGAARLLVDAVSQWGRERGAVSLALEVTNTSTAARALYGQMGFELLSEVATTCGLRRAPAQHMRRLL